MERTEKIAKTFGIKPSTLKTIAKIVVAFQLIGTILFAVFFVTVFIGVISRIFTLHASAEEPLQSQTYSESTSIGYSYSTSESVGCSYSVNESENCGLAFENAESTGVSESTTKSYGFSIAETEDTGVTHTTSRSVNVSECCNQSRTIGFVTATAINNESSTDSCGQSDSTSSVLDDVYAEGCFNKTFVFEFDKELNRPYDTRHDGCVWEDTIPGENSYNVSGKEVWYTHEANEDNTAFSTYLAFGEDYVSCNGGADIESITEADLCTIFDGKNGESAISLLEERTYSNGLVSSLVLEGTTLFTFADDNGTFVGNLEGIEYFCNGISRNVSMCIEGQVSWCDNGDSYTCYVYIEGCHIVSAL